MDLLRIAGIIGILWALAGCTHLGTVEGAIPIAPGASDFTAELQVSRAPNLLSTPTGIPLPNLGFHFRRGLSPDMDVGIHLYPLAIGADLRYRFAEHKGWHFAFIPGFNGMLVPLPGFQYGHLDLSFPLRAERLVGKGWSVAGGPAVVARQTFLALSAEDSISTATSTFEIYAGGGVRLQSLSKRLKLGISADLYIDTSRATGLYGGLGFDIGTVAKLRPRSGRGEDRSPVNEIVQTREAGTQ